MIFKNPIKYLYLASVAAMFLLFVYSGIGVERKLTVLLGFYVSLVSVVVQYLRAKYFKFPPNIPEYLFFLLLLLINTLLSFDYQTTSYFLLLYLSGGLIWILSYNISSVTGKKLSKKILLLTGIIFGTLFLLNFIPGGDKENSYSVFLHQLGSHNHIGDLWAVLLIMLLPNLTHKKRLEKQMLYITLAIIFVLVSNSRSALLSILAGCVFYFWKKGLKFYYKKYLFLILLSFSVFIFFGFQKSLFGSRMGYFFTAFSSFSNDPFGSIGVGNFGSSAFGNLLDNANQEIGFTGLTHNLILEFLFGMGVWAFIFIYWFIKVNKDAIFSKGKNLVYRSMFLALSVNFMFDYTYALQPFVWIWFFLLGLSQTYKAEPNKTQSFSPWDELDSDKSSSIKRRQRL